METARANRDFESELSDPEHPCRVLTRLLQAWVSIIVALCIYFLSFGPVLRFYSRPIVLPVMTPLGKPVMAQGVSYPPWVNALYSPAFYVVGHDPRPEYRHHDLLNTYKRYLQWWTP